jgi:hypothetical protein
VKTLRIEARNEIGKMMRPSGESEIKFLEIKNNGSK